MALGYGRTSTQNFGTAKFIVDINGIDKGATHSSIAAAVASAVSGDTVFVKAGTYVEDFTIPAGIDLVSYSSLGVTITGKITMTAAGTSKITGITLKTNSDFALVVSGTVASTLQLIECNLIASNNTFLSHTSSSAGSSVFINRCSGNIETTGIGIFASSSAGSITIRNSQILNSGATTTASTISAGTLLIEHSLIIFPIATSATAIFTAFHSRFVTSGTNTTSITHDGSGANSELTNCEVTSGSATPISIGAAATLLVLDNIISSSNASLITVAGSAPRRENFFANASSGIYGLGIGGEPIAGTLIQATKSQNAATGIEVLNTTDDTVAGAQIVVKSSVANKTGILCVYPPNYSTVARNTDRVELQSGAGCLGLNITTSGDHKFYRGNTLEGTISAAGEWTFPLQPAFSAYISTDPTNVTGNGTAYTLACNTEIFDRNADYNSGTYTFTAPVTGIYLLHSIAQFGNTTAAATLLQMSVITSNRIYYTRLDADSAIIGSGGAMMHCQAIADMDASDTATFTVQVNGEVSDVVDMTGANTWVQGWLLG